MKKNKNQVKPPASYLQLSVMLLARIKNGRLTFIKQDNRVIQINIMEM